MEINDITEQLKNDGLSPSELAELYTQLSGWYSYYGQMMKRVKEVKPKMWLEIKKKGEAIPTKYDQDEVKEFKIKPTSDKHTDMLWEATEEGQKEIALSWELKRIEQMMKAIKSRLYIERTEMQHLNH